MLKIIFLNGPSTTSFPFIFGLYKQTIQIQRQINVGSVPSRKVQCRFEGSDVTPFVHLNGTLKIYSPDGGECLDDGSMVTSMLRPDGI